MMLMIAFSPATPNYKSSVYGKIAMTSMNQWNTFMKVFTVSVRDAIHAHFVISDALVLMWQFVWTRVWGGGCLLLASVPDRTSSIKL